MNREQLHEKHGYPYPNGLTVTEKTKARALALAADPSKLLIRYIREEPKVVKLLEKGADPYNNPQYTLQKGTPFGCLVAFEEDGEILIGWSQRHRFNEPLSFNRSDARACAVMRGLSDTITWFDKKKVFSSVHAQTVPSPLRFHIPSFTARVKRYFKDKEIANLKTEA